MDGLSDSEARSALQVAQRLDAFGVAPLLTMGHLSRLSGVEYKALRRFVEYGGRGDTYRAFAIRKRSGGSRQIHVPSNELMVVQRWLNRFVLGPLDVRGRVHSSAYAYRPQKSVIDWAAQHCLCRWLVKFDVHNFFGSLREMEVYEVFASAGYPRLLSFELARLCTVDRPATLESSVAGPRPNSQKYPVIEAYGAHSNVRVLPQGAPTSPGLSNLVCFDLDTSLGQWAESQGYVYTRYADDLAFSSAATTLTHSDVIEMRRVVQRELRKMGLLENRSKFRVSGPGSRRIVGGLLVDGQRPRLSKRTRARLERHLHFIETRGPAAHAVARGFRSIGGMHSHLMGLLQYIRVVDESLYRAWAPRLASIAWPEV